MSEPETRRLFFALWPDTAVRAALVDVQRRLLPEMGRWVGGDNLHSTLLFLGDTPAERQRCLEGALTAVEKPAFTLQLDRVGYWRKPQVLWAGGTATPAPLSALVQDLRDVAARCGCVIETRPFQIHLTLCRKVRKPPRDLPVLAPISWPVHAFVLAESLTAAGGVGYRVLRTWGLFP